MRRSTLALAVLVAWLALPFSASADCLSATFSPGTVATGRSVTYTAGGSTISFQFQCPGGPNGGECRCGQFADYNSFWVAPATDGGVVNITGMTPAQTGTGPSLRNGAVADPATTSAVQGWDGRRNYQAALTLPIPYSVNTTQRARPVVILKASSSTLADSGDNKCNARRVCLDHVESLTVVARPPGAVFRPPYFGSEKEMVAQADFDPSVIPNLAPAGGEISLDQATAAVTGPPIDHWWLWNDRELFHPRANYNIAVTGTNLQSGYDGYINVNVLGAYMRSLVRTTTQAEALSRNILQRRIAQRGIDLFFIFKNGGAGAGPGGNHPTCGGWYGTGGYGPGRLPLILTSIALLNRQTTWGLHLRNILSTEAGRQCFGETSLIQPPTPPPGRGVALWGHKATSVYTPSATDSRTLADPQGLIDGGGNSESACVASYQQCCTSAIFRGGAVAMFMIPKIMANFPPGARHWLDWVDRISQNGDATRAGAYCSRTSNAITLYNEGYQPSGARQRYNASRECSRTGTCAGMTK